MNSDEGNEHNYEKCPSELTGNVGYEYYVCSNDGFDDDGYNFGET